MILVVDDSPTVLYALRAVLEEAGYEVATAADGIEALRLLDEGLKPAAILTDFCMPGLDGNDFINRLGERTEVPVLILSGYVDEVRQDVKQKVKGVYTKPLESNVLIEIVRQWTPPDRAGEEET